MKSTQDLLATITKFLKASGMSESAFGHKTVNDGRLVKRLRQGGSVTLPTAERILNFIEDNQPGGRRRVA